MARSKDVVFTMKLEAELRDAFMARAEAEDRSASQIIREFMRAYLAEQSVTPEYMRFVRSKVERSREQIRQGQGIPGEDVEAEFAKLRADVA